SGCNLRCSWCDSAYTSWNPEGDEMEVDEVVDEAEEYGASHTVVTGGEPFLQPKLPELCSRLKEGGDHITVETNATVYEDVEADLISMSPKLSNSTPDADEYEKWSEIHERERLNFDTIEKFIDNYDYQLKFVVADEDDVEEIDEI
ncbi:MAG: 7-carboxy-7-deazaguanine synthase QueE, partial [Halobacteria archaeon]|nr:7-carboxy-7-deazaguanine synthase QueE [Halobacteria archaeon]